MHSEFSDHQAWSELVADKRPRPSPLKKLAINKYCESLTEGSSEIAPDLEAERDEILRQQPMTD